MSRHESEDASVPDTDPTDTSELHRQVLQMKAQAAIHVPAQENRRYVTKRQAGRQHGWLPEAGPGSISFGRSNHTSQAEAEDGHVGDSQMNSFAPSLPIPQTPDPTTQSIYPSGDGTSLLPGLSATHAGGSNQGTAITTPTEASHAVHGTHAQELSTTVDGITSSVTSEADTTHS
ncbi:hypothetical protein MJO28_007715 [Puccinia striiformis f. sp. tritici]|nr:hypothetical protein MJO28_007715 [Puccinia striiformis f. sp. tritici]KAI7956254.1 hypothetical protein MJO29_007653 [Puccinia striiformis f. sp. tritici]KAI9604191.1 hypothetical protein H4Q26_003804 [Puccinia striiformis f. sp. tritici PST-130]